MLLADIASFAVLYIQAKYLLHIDVLLAFQSVRYAIP